MPLNEPDWFKFRSLFVSIGESTVLFYSAIIVNWLQGYLGLDFVILFIIKFYRMLLIC